MGLYSKAEQTMYQRARGYCIKAVWSPNLNMSVDERLERANYIDNMIKKGNPDMIRWVLKKWGRDNLNVYDPERQKLLECIYKKQGFCKDGTTTVEAHEKQLREKAEAKEREKEKIDRDMIGITPGDELVSKIKEL